MSLAYKIHAVLTDCPKGTLRVNGIQFRFAPRYADGPTARYMTHMFDMRCRENGIEHRFTKINHPWTTDVIDKSFLRRRRLNSWCTRVNRVAKSRTGGERPVAQPLIVVPPLRLPGALSGRAVASR